MTKSASARTKKISQIFIISALVFLFYIPKNYAAETPKEDSGCSLTPGEPKLQKGKYKDYELIKGNSEFTEKVQLEQGVILEVKSFGCEDSSGTTLVFLVPSSTTKLSTVNEAAAYVRKLISSIYFVPDVSIKNDFEGLVGKLPKLTVQRADKKQVVRFCNNGKFPKIDEACGLDDGGETKLEVEPAGSKIKIEFTHYFSA